MTDGRRFIVKGVLGQGAFGRVVLADLVSHGGFRKEVALKVLVQPGGVNDDGAVRFRDEARLLGLLRHRNIVAVDDLVRLDEGWGIVMEVVPGVDLRLLMEHLAEAGRPFPPRAAADVVLGVARALEAAHEHRPSGGEPLRVIHRDIKPGNIRITPEGEVKVLDFGIARADFQAREMVTSDSRMGSLAYMSPERVVGEGADQPASDVYALGVVLWEMLALRQRGRARLREDLHGAQVDEMLGPLRGARGLGGLPELIEAMVDFHPDERPAAGALVARLRERLPGLAGPDLEALARAELPGLMAGAGALRPAAAHEHVLVPKVDGESTTVDLDAPSAPPLPAAAGPAPVPGPAAPAAAPVGGGRRVLAAVGGALALLAALGVGLGLRGPAPGAAGIGGGAGAAAGGGPAAASAIRVQADGDVPDPSGAALEQASAAPELPSVDPAPIEELPANTGDGPPAVEPPAPARPARAAAARAPAPAPAPAPEAAAASGPRIRAVKFTAPGASRVEAQCGATVATGTSSALVRDAPPGPCAVTATVDGAPLRAEVTVDQPRGYTCERAGGGFACR
jgi:hypothetical protein